MGLVPRIRLLGRGNCGEDDDVGSNAGRRVGLSSAALFLPAAGGSSGKSFRRGGEDTMVGGLIYRVIRMTFMGVRTGKIDNSDDTYGLVGHCKNQCHYTGELRRDVGSEERIRED